MRKFVGLRVETTTKCKLKCKFCFANAGLQGYDLDFSIFKQTFNEALRMGIKKIRFTGGDPAYWEYLFDALELCYKNNIPVDINTMDPAFILDNLNKLCKYKGILSFTFSIFSIDSSKHDNIVGCSGHLKSLLDIIEKIDSDFECSINFTILKNNCRELSRLLKYFANKKIKKVSLIRLHSTGRAKSNNFYLSKKDWTIFFKDLKNVDKYGVKIKLGNGLPFCVMDIRNMPPSLFETPSCKAGCESLTLTHNGLLTPCMGIPTVFGSVKANSLKNLITNSEEIKKLKSYDYLADKCKGCFYLDLCRGGCRAAVFSYNNSCYGLDPLIEMIQDN